jgi:hypothetical protein
MLNETFGSAPIDIVAKIFNERIVTQSKAFVVLFIPVFTLSGAALFWRKRRYLSEHFIFATHYFTVVILFFIIFRFVVLMPGSIFLGAYNAIFDSLTSIGGLVLLGWYYGKAAKRFYQVTTAGAVTAALVNSFVFFLAMYAYRMLLFVKIIRQIHQ